MNAIAFSPDGTLLAAGDNNGSTYLFDVATRRLVSTLSYPGSRKNGVTSVAFSPDGKTPGVGDGFGGTDLWHATALSHPTHARHVDDDVLPRPPSSVWLW